MHHFTSHSNNREISQEMEIENKISVPFHHHECLLMFEVDIAGLSRSS